MDYARKIGATTEYIADIIIDMNMMAGPVSQDYIRPIAEKIANDVAKDIYETADPQDWNGDDVRLAVGRVLCAKLRIEI
jgi:hypothetical protein